MAAIEFSWTPPQLKEVREQIDASSRIENRAPVEKSDEEVVRDWMLDSVNEFMLGHEVQKGQIEATATARENHKQKRLT